MPAGFEAFARRIGLRNIAYLLFMVVLTLIGTLGGQRVSFLGGLVSMVFLLVNLGALARAMGRRLPTLPSALGVALALFCGATFMEIMMAQAGITP